MAKKDVLAEFLAAEGKDKSSVTMDELLVRAEDMTLAEHDKIHHPEGYKEGQECKLREDFKKANKGEELTDPNTELHSDTQVSSEARHSTDLHFGKWLDGKLPGQSLNSKQRYELQSRFQRATQDSTKGLLKELSDIINGKNDESVRKDSQVNLVGYYQNTGTDGLQEEIGVDFEKKEDGKLDVSDENKKVINTYCCLLGLLRKQDAVTWNAPIYNVDTDKQNGIMFDIGRKITSDEYGQFAKWLNDEISKVEFIVKEGGQKVPKKIRNAINVITDEGDELNGKEPYLGLVSTRNGVRIIDFGEHFADYGDFQDKLSMILEECPFFKGFSQGLQSIGDYLSCGDDKWSDILGADNGRGYFDKIKELYHDPEVQGKIKELYMRYKTNVDESERLAAIDIGYLSDGNAESKEDEEKVGNSLVKAPDWV